MTPRAKGRLRALALCTLSLSAGAACGGLRKARSSLYTPCRAREIAISHETYAANEETWVATCRGREYACSAIAIGNKVNYRCRPLDAEPHDAGAPTR